MAVGLLIDKHVAAAAAAETAAAAVAVEGGSVTAGISVERVEAFAAAEAAVPILQPPVYAAATSQRCATRKLSDRRTSRDWPLPTHCSQTATCHQRGLERLAVEVARKHLLIVHHDDNDKRAPSDGY